MLINDAFLKGYIMGLQEQVTDTSLCYEDLTNFSSFVWNAQYAFQVGAFEDANEEKGQVASDGGFAVLLQQFGLDMGLMFFNMY